MTVEFRVMRAGAFVRDVLTLIYDKSKLKTSVREDGASPAVRINLRLAPILKVDAQQDVEVSESHDVLSHLVEPALTEWLRCHKPTFAPANVMTARLLA